jgi:hypothetical protein
VGAVPALVVWGDRGGVIPVHHGRQAHEALPTSRLEIFAGAGHFSHHDDPDRFVALMREFVATTEPARHDRDAWRERLRQGPDQARLEATASRATTAGSSGSSARARRRAWSSTSVS